MYPRAERDRQGATGAPNIFQEILKKINKSAAAIFDVSIINLNLEDRISITIQNIDEIIQTLPDEVEKAAVLGLCEALRQHTGNMEPPELLPIEQLIDSLDDIEDEKKDKWQDDLTRLQRRLNKSLTDRPTPNPNVLVELGYALKHLGENRIILLFNSAYGAAHNLPFDLSQMARIEYNRKEGDRNKRKKTNELAIDLERSIKSILEGHIKINLIDETVQAIDSGAPNRLKLLENYTKVLYNNLDSSNSTLNETSPDYYSDLLSTIEDTSPLINDFIKLAESISLSDDSDACEILVESFRNLADRCSFPANTSGSWSDSQFWYFRVISKLLWTTFVASLLKRRRWELIKYAMDHNYRHQNAPFEELEGKLFAYIGCQHVGLTSQALEMVLSNIYQSDSPVTIDEYVAADFFLCLRGRVIEEGKVSFLTWDAPSYLLMTKLPPFLDHIRSATNAQTIATLMNYSDVTRLREEYLKRRELLTNHFRQEQLRKSQGPTWIKVNRVLENYQPEDIGKEP